MGKHVLTAERLRELLHYDPETGLFTRLQSLAPRGKVGAAPGCIDKSTGYIRLCAGGRAYYAHRLAWLHVYGEWPKDMVDHIDMDRTNNRLANLRAADKALNMQNQRKPLRSNTSGFLGVSPGRRPGRWRSAIVVAGKQHALGEYDSPEEAHQVYLEAKRRLHPGNTL